MLEFGGVTRCFLWLCGWVGGGGGRWGGGGGGGGGGGLMGGHLLTCISTCALCLYIGWFTNIPIWINMIMQTNNKKHDKTMWRFHYSDVTMSGMASQIADVSIICSKVCSSADQKKHQSSRPLASEWNSQLTGEFPAQRASNAENVSIWWRHHVMG